MSSPASPEGELSGWPEPTAEDRAALRRARGAPVEDFAVDFTAWLELLSRLELPVVSPRRLPASDAESFRL